LNGLVQAFRNKRISKEAALAAAEEAVTKRQALLTEIALRRAKRALKKDVTNLPPEMTERLTKIREETLKSFSTVLDDVAH
jgi:hypothetical protein